MFAEVVDVTGVVLTKLDGTAKGGIVIAVQRALGVPVKLVGLGEGPDDLAPFDPVAFADALLGTTRLTVGYGATPRSVRSTSAASAVIGVAHHGASTISAGTHSKTSLRHVGASSPRSTPARTRLAGGLRSRSHEVHRADPASRQDSVTASGSGLPCTSRRSPGGRVDLLEVVRNDRCDGISWSKRFTASTASSSFDG